MGVYDDQVFYAKLALAHPVWANPQCLARYRKHPQSTCATFGGTAGRAPFLDWLSNYRKSLHP